ncbi:MAG: hypothetical protein LBQ11_02025 [Candidatus Nomurabacteria bacterium]|jgi:hypothetical protein|nr:hypothetical protein [Candidatus Nomurabacteria bacterium]
MVCIAAFIILAICVLSLPIIRIFNKKAAGSIWKLFKKSTHCVSRRATFRKCDSSFKDDIKNSILRKVVIKHPNRVKPLSIIIEITSVLIILITIWSLLVGVKSLASLYVYGTCTPSQPSACVLNNTEACGIDSKPVSFWQNPFKWTGNWFSEFGEAIVAIPTRMKHWDARDYLPDNPSYYNNYNKDAPIALDILDPGCIICRRSYIDQKSSGFFDKYDVVLMVYPIRDHFANSYLISRYIEAINLKPLDGASRHVAWLIIDRIFTGQTDDGDNFQNAFNFTYNDAEARTVLNTWLSDFGYNDEQITEIIGLVDSDQVKKIIDKNRDIVDNQIKTKKIPTMIYDGKRHDGLFRK